MYINETLVPVLASEIALAFKGKNIFHLEMFDIFHTEWILYKSAGLSVRFRFFLVDGHFKVNCRQSPTVNPLVHK